MFDLIAKILAWFYELWPSFGMSIALLTLLVMIFLTPLTLKGTRSMIKMQRLQPEMKKIQNRHKGDRERMNKELMAFYQANSINPMGGCIPMIAQPPVFLVLYNVLRGLTRRQADVGEAGGWLAGRLSGSRNLTESPDNLRPFFPDYLPENSLLFSDLSEKTEMVSWGFDLSKSFNEALRDGILQTFPYFVLILIVFVSSWYMNRQIRGRNKGQAVNPQQELIMKIMPFFLPVISIGLDAALVSYFVVSNLFRTVQQAYITRTLYGDGAKGGEVVIPAPVDSQPSRKTKGNKTSGVRTQSQPRSNPDAGGKSLSDEARSRRTTAGGNQTNRNNSSDSKGSESNFPDEVGTKRKSQRNRKSVNRQTESEKVVKTPKPRRGRRRKVQEPEVSDGRPPSSRKGGGRTTPPGTTRARAAGRGKKKKRK